MSLTAKGLKALLQARSNSLWQPEVQRGRDQSRGIGATRQVKAQLAIDEICHALGRSRLFHVCLLPANPFQLLLIVHHTQHIVTLNILWTHFNYHSAITPLRSTICRTHAVHHDLLRASSSRNDKATRTHAETIDATPLHLSHKRILCGRKPLASTFLVMVLNLIYQLRRMLQSNTYGNTLCFYLYLYFRQIAVNVSC